MIVYLLLVLTLFLSACAGREPITVPPSTDTALYLGDSLQLGDIGATNEKMFSRNIVLAIEGYQVAFNNSARQFQTFSQLSTFIKSNFQELSKERLYLLIDSSTHYSKIQECIDELKRNGITDYKVVNFDRFFSVDEPVTISTPV